MGIDLSWRAARPGAAVGGAPVGYVSTYSRRLHSGAKGWTCICHRENGNSTALPLGAALAAAVAKRVAVEAMLALGTPYDAQLLALLGRPAV